MLKPHGIMLAIGLPSPFAHEPDPDEQREQGKDEHEEDTLDIIYSALRDGDQSAMRVTWLIARCLAEMAQAAHRGDDQALNRAYHECREAIDSTCGDDSEDDHHE